MGNVAEYDVVARIDEIHGQFHKECLVRGEFREILADVIHAICPDTGRLSDGHVADALVLAIDALVKTEEDVAKVEECLKKCFSEE